MDFSSLFSFLDKHGIKYKKCVKTASLVSIKIGGIASIVVYPDTLEQLCYIVKFINNKFKYFILANGTNTFFCDYYDGVVILTRNIKKICLSENEIIAECGVSLTECAMYAYENSLCGMEFAYGIPGTIGGGVYINASAYNGAMSNIVKECLVYDIKNDSIYTLKNKDIRFSNKNSIFINREYVILNARLSLSFGTQNNIKPLMESYIKKRVLTQPLNLPSAGSVFKRPKNNYASKLIDDAGLKGYCIGEAQISTKHAGFIINKGNATPKDMNDLIKFVKSEIKRKFNINLEEEIIYVE